MKNLFFFSLLLWMISGYAQVKFVTPVGAGTMDGTSWGNAYGAAQFADNLGSSTAGTEFWVAAGTYLPTKSHYNATPADSRMKTFYLPSGVKIYGGFNGTESNFTERNWNTNLTTLSGDLGITNDLSDNSYNVVYIKGSDANTRLDGCTITKGNANHAENDSTNQSDGGGIHSVRYNNLSDGVSYTNNFTLANCRVEGNYRGVRIDGDAGLNPSNPVISSCYFAQDLSPVSIYVYTHISITNSFFYSRLHTSMSANISNSVFEATLDLFGDGSSTLENNTFQNINGDAISINSFYPSSKVIRGCKFLNNSSSNALIWINSGSNYAGNYTIRFDKCVFVNNACYYVVNSGFTTDYGYLDNIDLSVTNCVFANNEVSICLMQFDLTGDNVGTNNFNILNNTFFNNFANPNLNSPNISLSFGTDYSTINIKNNIFWQSLLGYVGTNVTNTYTVSNNITPTAYTGPGASTGNTTSNPLFVNQADPDGADNLWGTLDDGLIPAVCGSPAIDMGENTALLPFMATDVSGAARTYDSPYHFGSSVDIGAYENSAASAPSAMASSNSPICGGGGSIQLAGISSLSGTYQWTGPNNFSSALQNPTIPNPQPIASGTYHLTFSAFGNLACQGMSSTSVAVGEIQVVVTPHPTIHTQAGGTIMHCNGGYTQGYTLYYKRMGGNYPWMSIAVPASNFTLTGLLQATSYSCYAQDINGNTSFYQTFTTSGTPNCADPIPSNITATVNCNQMIISWTGSSVQYLTSIRRVSPTLGGVSNTYTTATARTYTIPQVGYGGLYEITILGMCGSQYTPAPAPVYVYVPDPRPAAPVLNFSSITCSAVALNWLPVPGATLYKITFKNTVTGNIAVNHTTMNTSYTRTGLPSNRTYEIWVTPYGCNTIAGTQSQHHLVTTCNTTTTPIRMQNPNENEAEEMPDTDNISEDTEVLQLYPNPNNGNFTLTLPIHPEEETTLSVFSIAGQKIHSQKLNTSENNFSYEIQLSQVLPSGVYLCKVQTAGKNHIRKFIVE